MAKTDKKWEHREVSPTFNPNKNDLEAAIRDIEEYVQYDPTRTLGSTTKGIGATTWSKVPGFFTTTSVAQVERVDYDKVYLVKIAGDVYITDNNPSRLYNATFGEHIELTSYDYKRRITCLAEEYFTHAKIICSLGQVINSIAEAHIDKK